MTPTAMTKGTTTMTATKKTTAAKKAPVKAKADEKITIVAIAAIANRSPKVLRAIARNEAYRLSQGKARRLPEPVEGEKHMYYKRDLDAFLKAIAND